tara:strand:+ start:79 stop:750 length:672 start_codon:yes stop_codon:yes gene_type:complete
MKNIKDIFKKSPFGLLTLHITKVDECIKITRPVIEKFIAGDFKAVDDMFTDVTKKEHEADLIKDDIREHLPKSIFMPVSREDVLKLLHRQDSIADYCEDIAILLSVRNTVVIDELKEDFLDFAEQALSTAEVTVELVKKMHDLMESSFSGPSASDVLSQIENIGYLEWKSDKKKYKLVKKMFSLDKKIDPVSQVLFLKIFDVISGVADSAENTANALRLMISK